MKMRNLLLLAITVLLLAACDSGKNVPYMINIDEIPTSSLSEAAVNASDFTIKPGDMLQINVTASNDDVVKPFNKIKYVPTLGTTAYAMGDRSAMFYIVDDTIYELFTDSELQTSAGLYVKMNSAEFHGCTQCWEGAVQAPGAKYPWICPNIEDTADVRIRFEYEGKESVMPWGSKLFGNETGNKEWGCASIPTEFGDDSLAITANGGEDTFDLSKFKMILILKKRLKKLFQIWVLQ